jgi:hypothetical protein
MASENPAQQGLIPFMYWVLHDIDINKNFHSNEALVMSQFGLGAAEQDDIIEIGRRHDDPRVDKDVQKFLNRYLLNPFLEIWSTKVTSEVSEPPAKGGWISFSYHARYDRRTSSRLRESPGNTLERFKIRDPDAVVALRDIAANPRGSKAVDAARAVFARHFVNELLGLSDGDIFW